MGLVAVLLQGKELLGKRLGAVDLEYDSIKLANGTSF